MFSKLKSPLLPPTKPTSADSSDCRRRNRLSKPPTNRSSLNLSSLSLSQPGTRNSTLFPLCTPTEELEDHSPIVAHAEPQEHQQARNLDPDFQDLHEHVQHERKSWRGLTLVVNDIETRHSASPTPKSPIGSPLSAIFNTSRLSLVHSKDKKDLEAKTLPRTDERLVNAPRENLTSPIPIRRVSLRQPGIATRIKKDERWDPSPPGEERVDVDRDYYYNPVFPEEASRSEGEALTLEVAKAFKPVPPPLVRTETPSDLVFLGGLKLGSLHITNGRASPTPSDLSRTGRARSTPNLRNTSSEYGESHAGDNDATLRSVPRDGSPKRSTMSKMHQRSASQATHYQSPLRLSSNTTVVQANTMNDCAEERLEKGKRPANINTERKSPDRSTFMAEEYMAELPASPFGVTRRKSASGSILKTTTKPNECDDNLFEDESLPSDSDSADDSTLDTFYSSNGMNVAEEKPETSLQKSRPAYTLADSGYSSNSSLRAARMEIRDEKAAGETQSTNLPPEVPNTTHNELTIPKGSQDRRPGPRPLRPSILKQARATTTSLPIFHNLYHSSTTISTVMTTASAPAQTKPRKLTKLRLFSRSASSEIIVQGIHHDLIGSIPPIPPEFVANLAIRCQEVPELQHTYETRQHTAESPTTSHADPVEIRFPSPPASINESDHEVIAPPRPSNHREFIFRRRSRSGRAASGHHDSHDMSEADALATIQDFGTVGHSLGGNPYDIAQNNFHSVRRMDVERLRTVNPHNITNAAKRPKATDGMDAETAAELARIRSRTIQERDSMRVAEKRTFKFNDRGGLPGKNLRPLSLIASTPPMPSLPTSFDTCQRQSWTPQTTRQPLHEPHSLRAGRDQSLYDHNDWDNSSSMHDRGYWEDYQFDSYHMEDDRRNSWRSDLVEIDFDPTQSWGENDDYTKYDQMQNYHSSQGALDPNRQSGDSPHYDNDGSWQPMQTHWNGLYLGDQDEVEEDAAPAPPRHYSPRPTSTVPSARADDTWGTKAQAWEARRKLADEARRHPESSHTLQEQDSFYPAANSWNATPNLPSDKRTTLGITQSILANSRTCSYVGCPVESLYPPNDPPRMRPTSELGRRSGCVSYGDEHVRFWWGSAGTRSVIGVAAASKKSRELSREFSVDSDDAPINAELKKL